MNKLNTVHCFGEEFVLFINVTLTQTHDDVCWSFLRLSHIVSLNVSPSWPPPQHRQKTHVIIWTAAALFQWVLNETHNPEDRKHDGPLICWRRSGLNDFLFLIWWWFFPSVKLHLHALFSLWMKKKCINLHEVTNTREKSFGSDLFFFFISHLPLQASVGNRMCGWHVFTVNLCVHVAVNINISTQGL